MLQPESSATLLGFGKFLTPIYTLQLRLQGNAEARGGDLKAAEAAYSKALDLNIPTGKHLLLANRSGVRLSLGNADGALTDAQAAVSLAPSGFTTAHIRLVWVAMLSLPVFYLCMPGTHI